MMLSKILGTHDLSLIIFTKFVLVGGNVGKCQNDFVIQDSNEVQKVLRRLKPYLKIMNQYLFGD